MWIDVQQMKCRECSHVWNQEMIQQVHLSVWLAHVKSLRCPKCDAKWKKLSFLLKPVDGTKPDATPSGDRYFVDDADITRKESPSPEDEPAHG